jgi:hypothetical protein
MAGQYDLGLTPQTEVLQSFRRLLRRLARTPRKRGFRVLGCWLADSQPHGLASEAYLARPAMPKNQRSAISTQVGA